jgi:hypothetical protein
MMAVVTAFGFVFAGNTGCLLVLRVYLALAHLGELN